MSSVKEMTVGRWFGGIAVAALSTAASAATAASGDQGQAAAVAVSSGDSAASSEPAAASSAPPTAHAAPTLNAPGANARSGDIIVVAQRRREALQNVPIAVTAFTGKHLADADIHDVQHLALQTPNVYFDQATKTIYIRGIGAAPGGEGSDAAVSIFQDGVYLSRSSVLDGDLLDMDTVEVLRGPQGVLYGRNATGGAVLLNSRKPTDQLEGYARIGFGSYNWTTFSGAVGGPISSGVKGRIAFERTYRDGYVTNIFDGSRLANRNNYAARASLDFTLSPAVDLLVIGDYYHQNQTGEVEKYITQSANLAGIGFPQPTGKFLVDLNYPSIDNSKSAGITAILNADLGWAQLKSTSGYRNVHSFTSFDNDRTQLRLIEYQTPQSSRSWQEDLQLGNAIGRFRWLAGAYVYREDTKAYMLFQADRDRVTFPGTDLNGFIITQNLYGRDRTTAYSGYFELSGDLLPGLTVTGGGRYSSETREALANGRLNSTVVFPNGSVLDISSGLHGAKKSWNAFTPEARVQYKPSADTMIYFSATRGFKSGGISSETTQFFEPEYAWNYEAGLKAQSANHLLSANLAAFQTDYTHFQTSSLVFSNSGPTFVTGNGGKARMRGIELEGQANLAPGLQLSAYGSWLDAKYLDYADKVGNAQVNWAGNRIPLAPEWKAGISAEYGFRLAPQATGFFGGRMALQTQISWQSDMQGEKTNNPAAILPSFTLVNARASYFPPNTGLELSVFVRNLFNKYYFDRLLDHSPLLGPGTFSVREGEPRMVQAQVAVKF